MKCVNLEVLAEWVNHWYVPWLCTKYDVSQLDAVLGETVHEVEVEVREELWEIILYNNDNAKCCFVVLG